MADYNLARRIIMGRIAAPYGVRGWVKVQTFTENRNALLNYPVWQIGSQDDWRDATVVEARLHGQFLIAKLADCSDRDAAFVLRGLKVAVFRDQLPKTAAGEYYWEDLIGLTVTNRQGVTLGRVTKLIETGVHDVLVVKNAKKEHLIPFVEVYVLNVDLAQGRIEVDWGLDY